MQRYLRTLILITLMILAIGGAFVWIINPYWMWSGPDSIALVDPDAPRLIPNQRLAKAWHICIRKPDGLIIGTSRSEWGIDPEHPGWTAEQVYNSALAGATIYEIRRYLEHAYSVKSIEQVVLGLDLFVFDPEEPRNGPNFDNRYLCDTRNSSFWRNLSRWKTLVSIDGWRHAKELFQENGTITGEKTLFLSNGQREQTYFWYKDIQPDGHRVAFENSALLIADEFEERFLDDRITASKMDEFRKILQFAYEHEIDLRIALSPVHAWLLEIYYRHGDWRLFEEWKRTLVAENTNIAASYGVAPVPIWDFADYNAFTTEAVPPAGDTKSQMRWYWEVSHYTAALGEIVLDRVFGVDTVPIAGKETFGTLITPDNIEAHLHNIRERRARYGEFIDPELRFLDTHIEKNGGR